MKIALKIFFLLCIMTVSALGQGTESVNVWNVYCNGDGSKCAIAKELTSDLMFAQFPGKVDWDTAQEWLAAWNEKSSPGNTYSQQMPIGTGTSYDYNGIAFNVEGVSLKVNAQQATDSIDLAGRKAKAVHILEFAGWSLEVPTGTKVGQVNVYYRDGTYESADLVMGVNIAEWAYDRPENQAQLMHSKVEAAYSWLTNTSSSSQYQGHYFYVKVDTDPSKPLDRLELALEPTEQKMQIEIRAITIE